MRLEELDYGLDEGLVQSGPNLVDEHIPTGEELDERVLDEAYLAVHGNIKVGTIRNRAASVKLFLCATFPDGDFERRAITLKDVVDYHTAAATEEGATMRALRTTSPCATTCSSTWKTSALR